MKILSICQDYPSAERPYAMSYVHTRAKSYRDAGHTSHALSFSCTSPYERDGVSVLPEAGVSLDDYDVLAVHAVNLRNHMRLLRKSTARRIVFFWHGQEALRTSDYPPPYSWNRNRLRELGKALYDEIKLPLLRRWLINVSKANRVSMVFVSKWMRDQFMRTVGLPPERVGTTRIIPNAVHPTFHERTHKPHQDAADCVTIRPIDRSCHAVDLVLELARANPDLTFHVYGLGRMFDYVDKPSNVEHFPHFMLQENLPGLLNRYRAAVMPTRHDSQGVMACEMATYGIPLVSSDIEVVREMLGDFQNVTLRPNDDFASPLDVSSLESGPDPLRRVRFDPERITALELELFDA